MHSVTWSADGALTIDSAQDCVEVQLAKAKAAPELAWLYSHCRALGMTCKSDSGKWEHDIALFTMNQKEAIEKLSLPVRLVERNFCERCGQRLGDSTHIHTCTPPI